MYGHRKKIHECVGVLVLKEEASYTRSGIGIGKFEIPQQPALVVFAGTLPGIYSQQPTVLCVSLKLCKIQKSDGMVLEEGQLFTPAPTLHQFAGRAESTV